MCVCTANRPHQSQGRTGQHSQSQGRVHSLSTIAHLACFIGHNVNFLLWRGLERSCLVCTFCWLCRPVLDGKPYGSFLFSCSFLERKIGIQQFSVCGDHWGTAHSPSRASFRSAITESIHTCASSSLSWPRHSLASCARYGCFEYM